MIRKVVTLAVILSTTLAGADPRHVLVLKTEGTADAATRAKIDAAVLKLAKGIDGQVTAGDISFDDATAAIGCKPEAQACKDEVLSTLAVDEVVIATATRKPGGIDVTVRRIAKGTPQRDATTRISGEGDPQLDTLGLTLFGGQATPPVDKPPIDKPPVDKPPVDKPPEPPVETGPPDQPAKPEVPATLQPQPVPAQPVDEQRSRLVYAGLIGGPALLLLSFVLWGQASSTQDQINTAPTKTKQDIQNLQNLEQQGRSQAGGGNLLFVGGVVIAGISAYFFFRDRQHHSAAQARITPTVFDHGAGVTLTLGGSP